MLNSYGQVQTKIRYGWFALWIFIYWIIWYELLFTAIVIFLFSVKLQLMELDMTRYVELVFLNSQTNILLLKWYDGLTLGFWAQIKVTSQSRNYSYTLSIPFHYAVSVISEYLTAVLRMNLNVKATMRSLLCTQVTRVQG